MKTLITAVVVVLSAAAIGCQDDGANPIPRPQDRAAQKAKAPALENTRWHVTATAVVSQEEKPHELEDALLFADGKVASAAHAPKGFAASTYTITNKDGKCLWATQQVSAKEGEVAWSCEIDGDKLAGTMVCTDKASAVTKYKVVGIRAPTLETTSWLIEVADVSKDASNDQAKPRPDTMLFMGHKVTAKDVRSKGFAMSAYRLVPGENGAWSFEAEQHNRKEKTRLVWKAEVKGDKITGTLTLFAADGQVQSERTFKGTKTNKRVRIKKPRSKRGNQ